MSQEDKLKDALRDYYDNQNFDFDNREWEQARTFVNAAREARNKRRIILWSMLALLGLLIPFFTFYRTSNIERNAKTAQFVKEVKTKVPEQQVENNQQAAKSNVADKAFSEVNPKVQKSNASTPVPSVKPFVSLSAKKDLPQTNKTDKPVILANTKSQTIISDPLDVPEIPVVTQSPDITAHLPNQETQVADVHENKDDNNSFDSNPINTGLAKQIDFLLPISFVSIPTPEQNKDVLKDNSNNPVENLKTETNVSGNKVLAEDTSAKIPEAAITLLATQGTGNTAPETSGENPIDSIQTIKSSELFAQEGVFYELGFAWNYGWKSDNHTDARGFSPVLGINYMNALNERCALSFGVQFNQVRNLSESTKISRESTFRYGEQTKVTEIAPSTLHYLTLPLRFNYFIDDKQSLGAGFNLAYLLNVNANVTTYEIKPGYTSSHETESLGGYTEGFSWYDCQLAVFYRRRISNNFGIHAELFYGFTDVKQNSFFDLNKTERNTGIKLSLVYYAFRKSDK